MLVEDYAYIAVCIAVAGLCSIYGCVAHKCRAWSQQERRDRDELAKPHDSDDDWNGDCLFDQADDCEQGLALHARHHDSPKRAV
jgi:hypothetical protein